MQATHCPVCFAPLETREVAPCYDCGHIERELAELAAGEHTYAEYQIFGLRVVLSDYCDADFGSYYPSYFGLPDHDRQALDRLEFVREVDPATQSRYDKYCSVCQHRLAFLRFLAEARARHRINA
jgi:hypothetical protein